MNFSISALKENNLVPYLVIYSILKQLNQDLGVARLIKNAYAQNMI